MNSQMIIELIGYLGSALVVVSMLMASVVKLRIVNTIGSVIFMSYALIIRSYPTAVMNFALIVINIYHLVRLLKDRKPYNLTELKAGDGFVVSFLERNMADIREWFPAFTGQGFNSEKVFLVCCDNHPASLFIGRETGQDGLEILLDYATPVYRDTSAGRFLYGQLAQKGYKTLVLKGNVPKHEGYMEKTGFRKNEKGEYVLKLDELKF